MHNTLLSLITTIVTMLKVTTLTAGAGQWTHHYSPTGKGGQLSSLSSEQMY